MPKKLIKWLLIVTGVAVCVYGIFVVAVAGSLSDAFTPTYSKKDLIANFNKRSDQIFAVRDYLNTIVPKNKSIEIEFSSATTLERLLVASIDSHTRQMYYPIFLKWNLSISSFEVDSIIKTLNWTQETLLTLKQKLDDAHCISVTNGQPCQVGFQRSGMGMYFYDLFLTPISDSLKNGYNNGCTYIFFRPTVVLEYGGGAIGPQCFPRE